MPRRFSTVYQRTRGRKHFQNILRVGACDVVFNVEVESCSRRIGIGHDGANCGLQARGNNEVHFCAALVVLHIPNHQLKGMEPLLKALVGVANRAALLGVQVGGVLIVQHNTLIGLTIQGRFDVVADAHARGVDSTFIEHSG